MKIDQTASASTVQNDVISEDQAGQRIDNYLLARLKGAPRTLIYRILRKGEVRVNKGRIKPEYRLQAGDVVRIPPVRLPEPDAPALVGQGILNALKQNIIYEDKGLIVVNKPAGLAVHGGSGLNFGVIEAMRQLLPTEAQQLELVHRLDRDTSGCLMIARKRSMLRHLHAELRGDGPGKGVDKRYLALVRGRWPSHVKKVHAPLLRSNLRSGERMVEVNPEGKESLTEFRVMQRFGVPAADILQARETPAFFAVAHQVRQALRAGLSDGWGGSMMGTEFSDVMFGTPRPIDTEANIGVMEKDNVNIVVHGHGVDGQVAALQVFFKGNVGCGVKGETAITLAALAFGAGQRIFLAGLRVQKYRKVLADRAKALLQQLLGCGADHYPVMFVPRHT